MAYGARSYTRGYLSSGGLPPAIRWLLISNISIFLILFFLRSQTAELVHLLALYPALAAGHLYVWQLATHMFVHVGVMPTLWSMLMLWLFGQQFEWMWGTRRFLQFYFFCGIGSGLVIVLASYLFGSPQLPMFSCMGALYGLLIAAAVVMPDDTALFSFFIPMKMKLLVLIAAAVAFLFAFESGNTVGNLAQLFGGMGCGYLFLKMPKLQRVDVGGSLSGAYRTWRINRAKKKFQVYLRKQESSRNRRVQ